MVFLASVGGRTLCRAGSRTGTHPAIRLRSESGLRTSVLAHLLSSCRCSDQGTHRSSTRIGLRPNRSAMFTLVCAICALPLEHCPVLGGDAPSVNDWLCLGTVRHKHLGGPHHESTRTNQLLSQNVDTSLGPWRIRALGSDLSRTIGILRSGRSKPEHRRWPAGICRHLAGEISGGKIFLKQTYFRAKRTHTRRREW